MSGQKQAPSNPAQSTPKPVGQSPAIICYICQTPGHKAPQCPNKGSGNITPGRKPIKHQAVVRVPSRPPVPCLWATFGHHTCPIQLDTSARITVLPKDVVPEEAKTGQSIIITVTAMGQTSDAETAHVSITVGNHPWSGQVALASHSELNGRALLSLDVFDSKDKALLDTLVSYGNAVGVAAVTTRNMHKENQAVQQAEAVSIESQQLRVNPVNTPSDSTLGVVGGVESNFGSDEDYEVESLGLWDEPSVARVEGVCEDNVSEIDKVNVLSSLNVLSPEEVIPSSDSPDNPSESSEIPLPSLVLGGSHSELIETVNLDNTLKQCREDADSLLNCYKWENGLSM